MKMRKSRIGILLLIFAVLTAAFYVSEKQASKAADNEYMLIYGEKYYKDSTFTAQRATTTVEVYPGTVSTNAGYDIIWSAQDDTTGAVTLTQNPSNKAQCNVKALGVGQVTLTATIVDNADSHTLKTISCQFNIAFAINKEDGKFKKIYDTDKEYSLVMYSGQTLDLAPLFNAPNTTFESSNPDIVTCTEGSVANLNMERCTAVGAGSGTITATYTDTTSTSTIKYSASIKVYVLPQVSNQNSSFVKTTAFATKNLGSIYVDALFGSNATKPLGEKIIWVIKRKVGASYVEVSNSIGKQSDLAELIPVGADSNKYTIDAKAGNYRIYFWTAGTYESETKNISKSLELGDAYVTYADVTVYSNLKELSVSIIAGDSYNLGDAFNIDTDTFKTLFESSGITPAGLITYNNNTGIISTGVNTGTVDMTIVPNTANYNASNDIKAIYEGTAPIPLEFKIHITIINGFKLNITKANMYVGATLPLEALYENMDGKLVWESSNDTYATVNPTTGLVTAKKATDNSDSNTTNDSVTITATFTMTNGNIKKASCIIFILPAVTEVKLSKTELTLPVGETNVISAILTPENTTADLTWVVSDKTIVDTNVMPGSKSIEITGKKVGSTVIMVMNSQNMIYTSCKITVTDTMTAISLSQTQVKVKMSQQFYRLKATTVPADVKTKLLWQSSNTAVATVDEDGMVTLVSAGQAIISVQPTFNPNNIMAQCNLTVTASSTGLTLNKTTTTIEVSKTEKLEVTTTPTNATSDIKWKTIDSAIATVSSTGLVTAVAPGKTYVTATTEEGHSATCTIIVTQAATGVKLDVYDLTLGVGDVYHVIAAPVPAGSTETVLTWTAKDPGIATVTDAGKVTGVSPGSTIILIKTKSGKVEYLYVTVKENIKGMTLNYATKSVTKNRTFTLKPVFTPSKPTNTKVTWTSSNTKIASVTSAGVVKGLKGGTAIITCKSQEGGYVATCIVTVNEVMTSLKLNHSSYRLGIGKTVTLKATIKTNAATNQVLRWTSSNTSIATVNSKGKITAKKIGKCTIRVKATDGSGEQDSCTIYVVRAATSIRLNKAVVTVVEGRSVKLSATIKPSNVTYKTPTWSSSNKDVAIVDSSGRVTGFKVGVATIKAVTRDNSNKTAYCIVKVIKEVAASSVTVSTKDMTMIKGQTGTVSVSIQPSNSTDSVTYSSDNRAIATVTNKGKITARTPGIATITITTSSGKQATVNVTVVGLNKSSLTMEQYDTETIWVEGAKKVSWFSTNPSVATVDSNGKVVAKKSGTTVINAMVNGIKLTCRVRVKNISN